jgi:hypothetical protein
MVYLHAEFHMSNSNGSFAIVIKLEDKQKYRASVKLFHILEK